MFEAGGGPTIPRGDALFDVPRQISEIVPKLHDGSGWTLLVPIVDWKLTFGLLDESSDEFRALSMMLWTVAHISTTQYYYRSE